MIHDVVTRSNLPTSRGLLIFGLLIFAGLLSPTISHAATKTVCDGGCDHSTIKAATLDTSIGDNIQVMQAKTYNESDINFSGRILISDGSTGAFIING